MGLKYWLCLVAVALVLGPVISYATNSYVVVFIVCGLFGFFYFDIYHSIQKWLIRHGFLWLS